MNDIIAESLRMAGDTLMSGGNSLRMAGETPMSAGSPLRMAGETLMSAGSPLRIAGETLMSAGSPLRMAGVSSVVDYGNGAGALWENGAVSIVVSVLALSVLVPLFFYWKGLQDFCSRNLKWLFVVTWIVGFLVYDIGLYPGDQTSWWGVLRSLLGVAPMAVVHAFGMFVLQSDVSAIHDPCYENTCFMTLYAAAHFLAAAISLLFVIKHFGFNIVAYIKRQLSIYLGGEIDDLYVFWGMSDSAYYFAKDFWRKREDPQTSPEERTRLQHSKIIIIRINDEKEGANERVGMERLFSFMSLSKAHLEKLQELQKQGCLATTTFGSLANLAVPADGNIIAGELQLYELVKLIQKTCRRVHMFFLESSAAQNIQSVANLRRDSSLAAFVASGEEHRVQFYCLGRYNSVHRVVEDELTSEHMEVKVVDSSHICVELLKKNPQHHPVNFVKVEPDATVSTPFNALVVGFGEVGVDATRFLYEFGAFVETSLQPSRVRRSEFHCHVVDPQMNELAGSFVVNTPSIVPTLNRREDQPMGVLNLYDMDAQSVEFYERLKVWINDLNYVVVATGDDETNISQAVRILRLAIRERHRGAGRPQILERLHILVRVQHDENGHIQKIASHYNRLWAAELASTGNRTSQASVRRGEQVDEPLALFGSAREVYSYDYIVSDLLKAEAIRFRERYERGIYESALRDWEQRKAAARAKGETFDEEAPWPPTTWQQEQEKLMQLTGPNKDFSPTYSGIMKLRRMQGQNFANSLHAGTKQILAKQALGEELQLMKEHGLVRQFEHTRYAWKDGAELPLEHIQRVMDVLAQTEHLRWNASHEIMGYQVEGDAKYKDEARLRHGCLRDWEELGEAVQSYDYNVADGVME